MKDFIKLLTTLISLILLTSCAPTRAQVLEEYTEPFAQKRKQLHTIAENLPTVGSVTENSRCAAMTPALIMRNNSPDFEFTGAMLMYKQLLDPDIDLYNQVEFDVGMGGDFLSAIKWTGQKNPLGETAMKRREGEFADQLEAALLSPYLVVNRIEEYIPAQIVEDSQFIPGYVSVEGFVIALENNAILCSFQVEAITTAETVEYHGRRPNSMRSELQWALEVNIREDIQEILRDITGGTIEYSSTSLRLN